MNRLVILAAAAFLAFTGSHDALAAKPFRNSAPQISGTPSTTGQVGVAYSFQPIARDREGDPLAFSILNKPAWATFSIATGMLAGTPTAAGVSANITISVSDGRSTRSLAPFAITVAAGTVTNTPPSIAGTPPTTALASNAYAFQPNAADPDGQPLRFAIANRPAWAAFDSATGRLAGTPTAADVGTYAAITISVSDGITTASLPSYSLTVNQLANGQMTVSWAPPQQNTDGSALTDLAGYRIYYGTSSTALDRVASVGTNLSSYVIGSLAAGTWYVAMTAINASGVESAPSSTVSKQVL